MNTKIFLQEICRFNEVGGGEDKYMLNKNNEELLDTVIYRNLDMTDTNFYSGFFDCLEPFDIDCLKWNTENFWGEDETVIYYLTLKEITEQLKEMSYTAPLTIFVNDALYGYIYQMGNHGTYVWEEVGKLRGYA